MSKQTPHSHGGKEASSIKVPSQPWWFRPSSMALLEICQYQKTTELHLWKTAIPKTHSRDYPRLTTQGQVPGNCYGSTAGGCRGLFHRPVWGHKPVCNSCKVGNNSATWHAIVPIGIWGNQVWNWLIFVLLKIVTWPVSQTLACQGVLMVPFNQHQAWLQSCFVITTVPCQVGL